MDTDACTTFYRDVLAVPVRQRDGRHVEVELGPVTATLTPAEDQVGSGRGVVLQVAVPDVRRAIAELRRRGATVLLEPMVTDWDTESAFVEGPDAVVVEIYQANSR